MEAGRVINFDSGKIESELSIIEFIEEQVKEPYRSSSYRAHLAQVKRHLNIFSNSYNLPLSISGITDKFLRSFYNYLQQANLRPNTISGIVTAVKTMCKTASLYGHSVHPTFTRFTPEIESPCSIALTMSEVTRIFYFQGLTKKQQAIRDLFVVGCLTGLRYSDYSRLNSSDIADGVIKFHTQKTGKNVYIPVHPYVKEALERNRGQFPATGLSISYFNRYMKMIAQKVGMTESISNIRKIGFNTVNETKPKYEMISSHTARRTFATIMYNSRMFSTDQIMMITGHTTEKSFFRYIRRNPEDNAKAMAAQMKMIS